LLVTLMTFMMDIRSFLVGKGRRMLHGVVDPPSVEVEATALGRLALGRFRG
jgi:hypothetical protein